MEKGDNVYSATFLMLQVPRIPSIFIIFIKIRAKILTVEKKGRGREALTVCITSTNPSSRRYRFPSDNPAYRRADIFYRRGSDVNVIKRVFHFLAFSRPQIFVRGCPMHSDMCQVFLKYGLVNGNTYNQSLREKQIK